MKRTTLLFTLLAVALLFVACDHYSEHIIRGTLYADSTKTMPIAGDTLVFYESDYIDPHADSKYLGYAITDAQGRWGFQYIRGFDNPYMQQPGAKLSMVEYFLLITRGSDTLYWEYIGGNDEGIEVWPGCWQHPRWWDEPEPADTIVENPKWRGGLL